MAETQSEASAENPNRLYRYLRADYALEALETGLLKIGRLDALNDPFELIPAIAGLKEDAPPQRIDELESIPIDLLNDSVGILCFCKVVSDPVVWTHYGDDHKGVAFGFDYPSLQEKVACRDVTKVDYPDSQLRPVVDFTVWPRMPYAEKDDIARQSFGRKARSWQYEQEYRIFIRLNACIAKDGKYWHPIPKSWLVQVVPGMRCPIDDDRFSQALVSGGFKCAKVKRAKKSRTKYEVEI